MAAQGSGNGEAHDTRHTADAQPAWRRLAWFAGLWLVGVGTLFVVASVIRWAIL
ncbi:MAG: DUF2474 domain-containing protein [Alphaproteobacteria bacterium]|uniref:DUF2474 domain-containing protein n=1 Tax=Stappia stellulata TaxID=71235 RepID=UPI001CD6124D|nr:DUF2474 domain-containing protein [Stappia stellulata]MBL6430796.1 DUF2474 domain-containing protein [Alphaproteobacteria bacterium]MCA1242883.1 DUF2474 domain-containing protein [Stappia stellulata]